MSHVHRSQGVLAPASPELKSEIEIVCALGEALVGAGGGLSSVPWRELAADYDRIRDPDRDGRSGFATSTRACASPMGSSYQTSRATERSRRSAATRSSRSRRHPT